MFKNSTYKQKLKFLGYAILPVLFLSYQLSIERTVGEYQKFSRSAEASGKRVAAAPLSELTLREARLESLYNRFVLDTFASDKNLLSIAGNFCRSNNLILKEYRTVGLQKSDSLHVLTRRLTVEGRFIPELKLIYDLETKRSAGRVCSGAFTSIIDQHNNTTKLDCTIYVQNLIP